MIKEFRDELGIGIRRYVKITRHPGDMNVVFHIGLELYFDSLGDYKCVLSYDNYEEKGLHGHRYHADGRRDSFYVPDLRHDDAIDWATDEMLRRATAERARYERELFLLSRHIR